MSAPTDHFVIQHGNLAVNVPRSLFKGSDAVPDDAQEKQFRKMLRERYPWLSENSLDVLMRNARSELLRMMDEETCGRNTANKFVSDGKVNKAIEHLEKHLSENPNDFNSWYMLGELLCKEGRTEEGYEAFRKGSGK